MLDEDLPDSRIVDLVLLEDESQSKDATAKNLKETVTATGLDINSKLDEALQELRSCKTTLQEKEEFYKNREKELEEKIAKVSFFPIWLFVLFVLVGITGVFTFC